MSSAPSNAPRIGIWFAATFTLFFTRAFLFSTWVSRGPEVKDLLNLDTIQMGLLTMLYPLGGLLGVAFSSQLVHRYGSKWVTLGCYAMSTGGLIALGATITAGQVVATGALLMVVGLPMAISDYVGNHEGSGVDRASKRSMFSAIHGAFGVGMLLGAGLSSVAIDSNVALATHFTVIALFTGLTTAVAAFVLPKHEEAEISPETKRQNRALALKAWTEKRSLTIALIGFSFIMAETSAGTWVPIALTKTGFSEAEAAAAFSMFWVVVTIMRLIGGYIVDAIGRRATVLVSAIVAASGIALFMLVDYIAVPYVALVLWGAGMAIGFPMSVSSMGDDPVLAPGRINMIITVVYISSMTVGPALGAVGQVAGIYAAFGIPLAFLIVSALLSKVTKPASA
jgi:fucose permease